MTALDALQRTLALEHSLIHQLGVLGGRTSTSEEPQLAALIREQYAIHRGRREQLIVMIRTLGGTPVAAAPAYEVPASTNPRQVRESAAALEELCSQTYAAQVADTTHEHRAWAMAALTESSLTQLRWGTEATSFPGAPELA